MQTRVSVPLSEKETLV